MPKGKSGRKGRGGNHTKNAPTNNEANEATNNEEKKSEEISTTDQETGNNNPQSTAHQLKELGNKEFLKLHFDRAVDYYSRSLKEEMNAMVLANRSAAYTSLEKYDLALTDAQECIRMSPKWWKGYVRLASIYSSQRQFDEAQKIIVDAMKLCEEQQPLHKALHEMDVKRINTLQRADRIVGGHHQQAEKFRVLFNWLLQNGAKFPKLYLKFFTSEFRAINATDRIFKDEDVMYIPHDCIMTSDVAKASDLGKAITNSGVSLRSKHSYLAGYLCQEREKGKDSRWFPYIDILPTAFDTVPIFFDKEKLEMLTGSIALKKIADRITSLRDEYNDICAHVPEFKKIPHKDFVWGRLVVITRIFGLVVDNEKTDGLVPLADMLNHKRPRETKWTYDQKRRGFVVTALQTIQKDCEVFDSYGGKCNSRFFVNYGFSLEENEDNEAAMILEFPKNDPQFNLKTAFLKLNPLDHLEREFQIPRQYKEKKVKECFSWLRVAHAQGNEFMIISAQNIQNDDVPPLSVRNELMVLTSLAVAAKRSLNGFKTTLEEDNKLLEDVEKFPKFSNMRNIILMRRGEKEVLHFYLDLLKCCKPLLQMKSKELRQKLTEEKKWKNATEDPLVQYVMNVVVPLVTQHNK